MRLHRVLATVSATLLLAGCGLLPGQETTTAPPTPATTSATSEAATTSDTPSDQPTQAGDRISGEGYSYAIPDGWEEATDEVKKSQPLVDTAVMNPEAQDNFRDNVNIVTATNSELAPDAVERSLVRELEGNDKFEDVTAQDRVQIDGVEAAQVWSKMKGMDFNTVQFATFRDGRSYVVTYSSSAPHAEASERAQEFLQGWSWE